MNIVILIGRLVADPEIRKTTSGSAVANYRLAVDRRFKREGEAEADFISCVAFGKAAEFAEKYLRKGVKIAVTGRIQTRSYDKNDGTKQFVTEIVVDGHEFCESKTSGSAAIPQVTNAGADVFPDDFEAITDDNMPF